MKTCKARDVEERLDKAFKFPYLAPMLCLAIDSKPKTWIFSN